MKPIKVLIIALILTSLTVQISAQGGRRRKPAPIKSKKTKSKAKGTYLFGDPHAGESSNLLAIDYLTERPRGSLVWLRMMSGTRVKGLLMNVDKETGVIVLNYPDAKKGEPHHGSFKASALEGVDY